MAKIKIPFGGLSFTPDSNVSKDGDMNMLVNLRNENGELVQTSQPDKIELAGKYKQIYYHSKAQRLLALSSDGKTIYDITDVENPAPLNLTSKLYIDLDDELKDDIYKKDVDDSYFSYTDSEGNEQECTIPYGGRHEDVDDTYKGKLYLYDSTTGEYNMEKIVGYWWIYNKVLTVKYIGLIDIDQESSAIMPPANVNASVNEGYFAAYFNENIEYVKIIGWQKIGAKQFAGLTNLKKVYFEDNLPAEADLPEWYEDYKYFYDEFIKETIVKSIDDKAFYGCTSLEEIILPLNVTNIGASAFAGCTNLKTVYTQWKSAVPERLEGNFSGATIYIPLGTKKLYTTNRTDWNDLVITELYKIQEFVSEIDLINGFENLLQLKIQNDCYYALYTDDRYQYLGAPPRYIGISWEYNMNTIKMKTAVKYFDGLAPDQDQNAVWANVGGDYINSALDVAYKDKRYIDSAMFVLVIRLFDDTYIQANNIQLIDGDGSVYNTTYNLGVGNYNLYVQSKYGNLKMSPYLTSQNTAKNFKATFVKAFALTPKLSIYSDISQWKDFISSIELYSTGSIMYKKRGETNYQQDSYIYSSGEKTCEGPTTHAKWILKTRLEILDEISNPIFYRVAKFDLDGNQISDINDTSPSNIAVQKKLTNLISLHQLFDKKNYLYNQRLHLYDVKKILFGGYGQDYSYNTGCIIGNAGLLEGLLSSSQINSSLYTEVSYDNVWHVSVETEIYVYLNTGNIVKRKGVTTILINRNKNSYSVKDYLLSPYLFYPDTRATKITFYIPYQTKKASDDMIVTIKETSVSYPLTPCSMGACYVNYNFCTTPMLFGSGTVDVKQSITITSDTEADLAEIKDLGFVCFANVDTFYKKLKDVYGSDLNLIETDEQTFYLSKDENQGKWIITGNSIKATKNNVFDTLKELGITLYCYNDTFKDYIINYLNKPIENNDYTSIFSSPSIDIKNTNSTLTITLNIKLDVTSSTIILSLNEKYEIVSPINFSMGKKANIPDEEELDDEEETNNVLYVSNPDNPFHYPYTYNFDGKIIAVASSAEEVSSGQFGQYPLYVFTSEGIWMMQVDTTGQSPYSSQIPVSREVCIGSICPVLGGVVFNSLKGILYISGKQVVNLSAMMDGEPEEYSSIKDRIRDLSGIPAIEIVSLKDYINSDTLTIGYDYAENELIVTNRVYTYSYIYNFTRKTWGVTEGSYDTKLNTYPDLQFYDSATLYKFSHEEKSNRIFAMTRPIKVDSSEGKRIKEAALRGTWVGQLYFYILGSNDGINWHLMGGCEHKEDTPHRDLIARCTRGKTYRFVSFALASPKFKGRLSYIEMEMSEGIAQNKLR